MNVKVDKSLCIGCGLCTSLCEAVFSMGDDGLAEANEAALAENLDAAKDTAAQCPAGAIEVND